MYQNVKDFNNQDFVVIKSKENKLFKGNLPSQLSKIIFGYV